MNLWIPCCHEGTRKPKKKVTDLIKKQKLPAVSKIVKGKDDSKPWNADARAKVCMLVIIDKG